MKYDSKNISIKYIIIGVVFVSMFTMLFSKMEVNAQTFYKTDISLTDEVQYDISRITVAHEEGGLWYVVKKDGSTQSFDTLGVSSAGYDDETYLHFREALYENNVLYAYRHNIYFFQGDVEYVTIPSNDGGSLYGMSGMYTVGAVKFVIETDLDQNITAFRLDKYNNSKLHYPQNHNYATGGTGTSYMTDKDIRLLTVGYGGNIQDSEGNDFFRVTPQGTIATVMKNNQIQLNPLQEIMKVLPMVILFLVGYLGLWKALEIFRRLLRKA